MGLCRLLAHGLGQHRRGFDVAPFPAQVGDGDDFDPGFGVGAVDYGSALRKGDDGRHRIFGVGEVTVCRAPANLKIDDAFINLVQRD